MKLTTISRPVVAALAALAFAAPSSAAPQCPPDAFEPNDDCASAATVGAGTFPGLTNADLDLDHYRIVVPAGQRLDVSVNVPQPDPNLGGFMILFLDDGSGSPCGSFGNSVGTAEFGGVFGAAALSWSAPASAPATFFVQVQTFGAGCTEYDLDVGLQPDPCQVQPPDAFEPNDDCASAAPLGVGSFGGLSAGIVDHDHFSFTLAPKEVVTVTLSGLGFGERVNLLAWDPNLSCGSGASTVTAGFAEGALGGGVKLANTTAAPRTFVVSIQPNPDQGTGIGFCVDYALAVTSEFDPCGAITGDVFDPNDTCLTAAPLDASQSDLKMHAWIDQDWYAVDVPARSTLRVRSASTGGVLQRPMMLWDSCGGTVQDFLTSSHNWLFNSADPRHWLAWHNEADFAVDTRLFMTPINQGFFGPFCDTYDLEFELTLGEPFCLPTTNSTGDAALLSASGSTQVGLGTLELSAAPVPANTVGLIFFGPSNKPPMPFGGGFLCVQGPLLRLPGSFTGPEGVLATSVDWTGTAAALTPGQSHSFQAWFRDPTATPNFDVSEGLEIAFQ